MQESASVVAAGDTVPCAGLDALCEGRERAGPHRDPQGHPCERAIATDTGHARLHSSPEEAAQTAAKAEIDTLIYTHYVPPMPVSGSADDWRALGVAHFAGTIEVGDDLHTVTI